MANEHSSCLICSNQELRAVELYAVHGLVKCTNCGFVFSRWIPTTEQLERHYSTYTRNDDISAITLTRYRELATAFAKYRLTGNWIDVGCGNGHLLKTVAESGWKVYGTEYTENAVEICRKKGIEMQIGKLNPENYTPGTFDIISSIEVMEHINDLHEEVERFRTLLRKGGLLYITTPNFNSISRFLLKERWSIVEYPEHLCYFTPSTLHKLLTMHGFRKVKMETTGISISRFRGTGTAEEAAAARRSEEALREKTEGNLWMSLAKKTANSILTTTRLGEALKAEYIRI